MKDEPGQSGEYFGGTGQYGGGQGSSQGTGGDAPAPSFDSSGRAFYPQPSLGGGGIATTKNTPVPYPGAGEPDATPASSIDKTDTLASLLAQLLGGGAEAPPSFVTQTSAPSRVLPILVLAGAAIGGIYVWHRLHHPRAAA